MSTGALLSVAGCAGGGGEADGQDGTTTPTATPTTEETLPTFGGDVYDDSTVGIQLGIVSAPERRGGHVFVRSTDGPLSANATIDLTVTVTVSEGDSPTQTNASGTTPTEVPQGEALFVGIDDGETLAFAVGEPTSSRTVYQDLSRFASAELSVTVSGDGRSASWVLDKDELGPLGAEE